MIKNPWDEGILITGIEANLASPSQYSERLAEKEGQVCVLLSFLQFNLFAVSSFLQFALFAVCSVLQFAVLWYLLFCCILLFFLVFALFLIALLFTGLILQWLLQLAKDQGVSSICIWVAGKEWLFLSIYFDSIYSIRTMLIIIMTTTYSLIVLW